MTVTVAAKQTTVPATPEQTQPVTTFTSEPELTSPALSATPSQEGSDPLASVVIDKDSEYTPGEQRYLYAMRTALNEEVVDKYTMELVVIGNAACEELDSNHDGAEALRSTLGTIDSILKGHWALNIVPADYVVLGAAAAICPTHKNLVMEQMGAD